MFENEGSEIESTTDVDSGSSSGSQGDAQPSQQTGSQQKDVPFHEHPRWKEVMEERNAERQRSQDLERRLADMDRRFQESSKQKPQDPMYERLKGIDPEFADYLNSLKSRAEKAEALEARLETFERSQFTNSAVNKFTELNKTNNVSPELAKLYEAALEQQYTNGQIKTVADVERAYNAIHASTKKFLEAQERSTIEKYTKTKQKDGSSPAGQPKGRSPSQGPKVEFSKDPNEAKAQLIKHIAGQLKGSRDQL
jgi:hypothetical protein